MARAHSVSKAIFKQDMAHGWSKSRDRVQSELAVRKGPKTPANARKGKAGLLTCEVPSKSSDP